MKQIYLMFIDWTDNNGIIGDIVRAVVGAIVLFIILSPFAILLSPVFLSMTMKLKTAYYVA